MSVSRSSVTLLAKLYQPACLLVDEPPLASQGGGAIAGWHLASAMADRRENEVGAGD